MSAQLTPKTSRLWQIGTPFWAYSGVNCSKTDAITLNPSAKELVPQLGGSCPAEVQRLLTAHYYANQEIKLDGTETEIVYPIGCISKITAS